MGVLLNGPSTEVAMIWTAEDGMQPLADVLAARGATIPDGWTLREGNGISADGRWVVGSALNADGFEEAFLADLTPSDSPGSSGGGSVDGLMLGSLVLPALWRIRRFCRQAH